jgi:hypothetical protein
MNAWLVPLLLGALAWTPAYAQEEPQGGGSDFTIGIRDWLSTGKTKRAHNAQGSAPILGNPTSALTYRDLSANALELHARKDLRAGFYVRGNVGVGSGHTGTLIDEDFLAGQFKFSESTSSVRGTRLAYWTADVGRDAWRLRGGEVVLGPFVGVQVWKEHVDAYGGSFPVNFLGAPPIGNTVPVISNETTWRALRVGLSANMPIRNRTRLAVDFALLPYASFTDEDSHFLRTAANDLGPAPNIHIKGRGWGFQSDLEVKHPFADNWEAGIGLRFWRLKARAGNRDAAGLTFPLTELESVRLGVIASISRTW